MQVQDFEFLQINFSAKHQEQKMQTREIATQKRNRFHFCDHGEISQAFFTLDAPCVSPQCNEVLLHCQQRLHCEMTCNWNATHNAFKVNTVFVRFLCELRINFSTPDAPISPGAPVAATAAVNFIGNLRTFSLSAKEQAAEKCEFINQGSKFRILL